MKRFLIAISIFAAACGSNPPDKSQDDPPSNGGDTNSATNNASNSATNSTTNSHTTSTNNTTNNSTNNPTNNSTSNTTNNATSNTTNNATNNTTNNATNNTNNQTNTDCVVDTTFTGQIASPEPRGGGVYTTLPLTNDSGLDQVLAMVPNTPDDPATIPNEGRQVLTPPISVDGARVTATSFGEAGDRRFWLQDGTTAIQVFLENPISTETVTVGMEVSFDALEVQNFEGHPQISALQLFTVLSEDNPVPVLEANNRALMPDDYGRIIRIGGTLVGPSYDCGGTACWAFDYPGGETVFRSKSMIVADDDCITFVGPTYSFPGPRQTEMQPTLQIDTINFDWYWLEL